MDKPSRAHIHIPRSLGESLADTVANGMGSWRFIIIQTVLVLAWMGLNVVAIFGRWDPYPFILLNLLFSTQAAYAAPIIMMSQNRQSQKDRLRDDLEAGEVHEDAQALKLLVAINHQQIEILTYLKEQKAARAKPHDK